MTSLVLRTGGHSLINGASWQWYSKEKGFSLRFPVRDSYYLRAAALVSPRPSPNMEPAAQNLGQLQTQTDNPWWKWTAAGSVPLATWRHVVAIHQGRWSPALPHHITTLAMHTVGILWEVRHCSGQTNHWFSIYIYIYIYNQLLVLVKEVSI